MAHTVTILLTEIITHDVKRFIVTKPDNYRFTAGQATEVAINDDMWRDQKRPFTFTSRADDHVLEFTIKRYDNHDGVTKQLHHLRPGDKLLIDDPWGAIAYRGPGVFIAGGAGITPFLAIFKELHHTNSLTGNTLLFANKTERDIIWQQELRAYFDQKYLRHILSQESHPLYDHGRITPDYLTTHIDNFDQCFYVCGPKPMVKDINQILTSLGAKSEQVIFEK